MFPIPVTEVYNLRMSRGRGGEWRERGGQDGRRGGRKGGRGFIVKIVVYSESLVYKTLLLFILDIEGISYKRARDYQIWMCNSLVRSRRDISIVWHSYVGSLPRGLAGNISTTTR